MIGISGSACILAALCILVLPMRWWLCALCAGLIHELYHLAAVYLFGGRVNGMHIGPGGAVITADLPCPAAELLCILAGPLGSLSLLLLRSALPELTLCGLVQGCFNLLPIYPLDGGRILDYFLLHFCPDHAERIRTGIRLASGAVIFYMLIHWGTPMDLPLFGCIVFGILGKRPCKQL